MKRQFWRCVIAGAAVALALGGTAAPAAAQEVSGPTAVVDGAHIAAGMADCSSGNFCAWVNIGFNDGPGQWSGNAPDYTFWGHGSCGFLGIGNWNNCASSVYNHGERCNLTFYDGFDYRGAYYNLPRGSYLADMTLDKMSDGGNANDRISSHRWCTF